MTTLESKSEQTGKKSSISQDRRRDPTAIGQGLPGNHMLPYKDQQKLGVRDNRYGLEGDNGYDQMVDQ